MYPYAVVSHALQRGAAIAFESPVFVPWRGSLSRGYLRGDAQPEDTRAAIVDAQLRLPMRVSTEKNGAPFYPSGRR